MALMLDPRLPLVWRSPDSLQLGVDSPRVVMTAVSTAHERMLTALAVGVTPSGLALIGSEGGLDADQIAAFHRAIQPALAVPAVAPHVIVTITGDGPTADRLEWRLREAGLEPRRAQSPGNGASDTGAPDTTDLAVVLGHFVLDPDVRQHWLRRDIPHLPVIFGDTSVTIGPFIEPGDGPCLYCLELHRMDADPAWPALASQLLGRRSSAETPFFASETANVAARMVLSRATASASPWATSITVDAETGERMPRPWSRHPDCGCAGIPDISGLRRRETAMQSSPPVAAGVMPPRRDGGASVPG
ncbi:MAG: TOMM precursor leader peptide-binding protein [Terrimesophilobacter sp.]